MFVAKKIADNEFYRPSICIACYDTPRPALKAFASRTCYDVYVTAVDPKLLSFCNRPSVAERKQFFTDRKSDAGF